MVQREDGKAFLVGPRSSHGHELRRRLKTTLKQVSRKTIVWAVWESVSRLKALVHIHRPAAHGAESPPAW